MTSSNWAAKALLDVAMRAQASNFFPVDNDDWFIVSPNFVAAFLLTVCPSFDLINARVLDSTFVACHLQARIIYCKYDTRNDQLTSRAYRLWNAH